MAEADSPSAQRIGGIASGLVGDLQDLLRGELTLARLEFDQKLRTLLTALVSVIGGALLAFAGLVVLLEGIGAVLAQYMPAWAALLIVGLLVLLVGGAVAMGAMSKLSLKTLTPERTIENVRSDAEMIKEHAQ